MADLVNDRLHHLAGVLDKVYDGELDLTVGLAELLGDGGRLARSTGHDVVRFLHGGMFFFGSVLATGFYRIGANRRLPTFNCR